MASSWTCTSAAARVYLLTDRQTGTNCNDRYKTVCVLRVQYAVDPVARYMTAREEEKNN